jgi:hypothetical protein
MKILWCWRCKMEIPMLDEEEYLIAHKLYLESFNRRKSGMTREEGFKPLLDYYKDITGFEETEPNAVMHHRIVQYGPPCEKCGKPYRTPKASFCAACGSKRQP